MRRANHAKARKEGIVGYMLSYPFPFSKAFWSELKWLLLLLLLLSLLLQASTIGIGFNFFFFLFSSTTIDCVLSLSLSFDHMINCSECNVVNVCIVNLRKEELGSAIGLYTIIILLPQQITSYYRIIIIKKIKLQYIYYYITLVKKQLRFFPLVGAHTR